MKKKLLGILAILSFSIVSLNAFTAQSTNTKNTAESKNTKSEENVQLKKFSNLNDAAKDYAGVLQEVSNYGSRQLLKTINPSIDSYVAAKKDKVLAQKWEETNTMLLEQFEVSVQKVNETGEFGNVVFLIKGYDEDALSKYLNDNADKYSTLTGENNQDLEVDVEKYINLQYDYLKNAKKVNLATSRVDFYKVDNAWKVIEQKK